MTGSPPHTWRKLGSAAHGIDLTRITSTYVEKTSQFDTIDGHSQDHLHIRGENMKQLFQVHLIRGSPPHTWRKHHNFCDSVFLIRITSTYVEKTFMVVNFKLIQEDHLHIRGENEHQAHVCEASQGSPPHTWRKH